MTETTSAAATARWADLLHAHIHRHAPQMMREPEGVLAHPYTVPSSPGSPFYAAALWDWDSWAIGIALGQVERDAADTGRFRAYERGSILNFLDHADDDGVIPVLLRSDGPFLHRDPGRAGGFSENMHKPVLAQHAAMLVQRDGDAEWLRPHLGTLVRFVQRYLDSHVHPETGLAYWQSDFAIGVDNDPSVFFRPDRSTAAIFLNSLLYRELLALGEILEHLGELEESLRWRGRAHDLADAVREHAWDERDGTFYSVDIGLRPLDGDDWLHRGAPRRWSSVPLRVDSWSSFLPLWAGIATQEQAERMVERHRDARTFSAAYGVRTLSRLEKAYDLRATHNPSNWLGPVWGISNYLVFRGLTSYGFEDDARELADKTIRLFGRDLEKTGSLHEYYHPDNGEPIVTHGFQNWNFLVLNMIAHVQERPVAQEF
ncbi:Glucosidase YgjK [Microbacterium lemovicicum]|uniref:Glucosidase YgjK n=1 Tax=Microbacterium lemovicicum TaxID=1072463 RepID=A0A3S9WDT0_9MICO|nr:trehalase family glycosidase [Microbacterium lemovicicum]AZS38258.1 Glucosidase YgjK [Microbacterium lemovicicum]